MNTTQVRQVCTLITRVLIVCVRVPLHVFFDARRGLARVSDLLASENEGRLVTGQHQPKSVSQPASDSVSGNTSFHDARKAGGMAMKQKVRASFPSLAW